jgi:uncharacterized membrane protein YcaP (DUF421 family)
MVPPMKLTTTSWVLTVLIGALVGGVAIYHDQSVPLLVYGLIVFLLAYIVGWIDGFLRAQSTIRSRSTIR